jgi:AcrR family transcriptional regulator
MAKMNQTEVQEKILHSANILFSEKGFDNVRMQDIADASGLPMGEITKYYPLKRDLYNAIMQGLIKKGKTVITKKIAETSSSAKETVISIIERSLSDEGVKKALPILTVAADVPNALAMNMRNRIRDYGPLLTKSIRDGIEDGSFSTEFPDECAELFMLLISHWNEKHTLEYDLERVRRRYDFLQKLMKQLGVDIVTDNIVEKLVEVSGKLYKAATEQTEKGNNNKR